MFCFQAIHDLLDNLVTDRYRLLIIFWSIKKVIDLFLSSVKELCVTQQVICLIEGCSKCAMVSLGNKARHVEEAIAEHQLVVDEKHKRHLIIEELTRLDRMAKTRYVEENRTTIAERRLSSILPSIEWMIEDLVSGRYFIVKDTPIKEQTPSEMLSLQRVDSKTHRPFLLQLC
eukprot:TRINITY_DN11730_c0_g1_i1.p1 TRINITY_DN11730_c0_g1~~TRINITY_DN11730_c0_g1_i1.p1  ORF type:complete len:173 (-),score=26.38 TRINITY_DN11730_c0_g1_i1:91-609(-)